MVGIVVDVNNTVAGANTVGTVTTAVAAFSKYAFKSMISPYCAGASAGVSAGACGACAGCAPCA